MSSKKKREYDTKWMASIRKKYPEKYLLAASAQRERLKARVFLLYGNCCNKCGFRDSRALQLDHKIRPAGSTDTSAHLHAMPLIRAILSGKENWLNYQLLCANCNWIKRSTNSEYGSFLRIATSDIMLQSPIPQETDISCQNPR